MFFVSRVSIPGSCKTACLENTLAQLRVRGRVAALVGDLATENDAARLARGKAPVKQITTETVCHLQATMIQKTLQDWDFGRLDFLFIENVGNLVCPSSCVLGEDLRFVLRSVTEGEDKTHKYPRIFNRTVAAVNTKMDLVKAAGFDEEAANKSIRDVQPGTLILKVPAKTGESMDEFLEFVETQRSCSRAAADV